MSERLRREDGFTLPELLVTLLIAVIVSFAAFSLIEFSMKRTAEVDRRVDATQRGRGIMDTVTRELRSQVCLDHNTAAMATRGGDITNDSNATFYADFTDGTDQTKPPADLHRLSYDAATKRITDMTYKTSWDKSTNPWTAVAPAAPTSTRVIASEVVQDGATPIFTYWAYDTAAIPSPSVQLLPAGAGGLALADLARVARIDITFRALPTHKDPRVDPDPNKPRGSVVMQDQVYVRAADPNDDAPTPSCA
jgi:prepilin-type N-terminal cleavage/methylation domain-containing protein